MKISLITTIIVILIGAAIVLKNRHELSGLRATETRLRESVESLHSIFSDSSRASKTGYSSHRRERRDEPLIDLERRARDLIELMKSQDEAEDSKEQVALFNAFASLSDSSISQLDALIGELRNLNGENEKLRDAVIGLVMVMACDQNPRAGLDLVDSHHDLHGPNRNEEDIIKNALRSLADDDPAGALQWIKLNREKYSESISDEAVEVALIGMARQEPAAAILWLENVEPDDQDDFASKIAASATTADQRTALLDAIDGRDEDPLRISVLQGLARSFEDGDFEKSTEWIENQKLAPEDLEAITSGISVSTFNANAGAWISWMTEHMPPESIETQVITRVKLWTQDNYKAAGDWLETAPDNAAKIPAISAYVERISYIDRTIAEQWALKLPAGERRDAAFEDIIRAIRIFDPSSEEAFRQRHGL